MEHVQDQPVGGHHQPPLKQAVQGQEKTSLFGERDWKDCNFLCQMTPTWLVRKASHLPFPIPSAPLAVTRPTTTRAAA